MLWLCLHLPNLPLEICSRAAPTDDLLVIGEGHGREQRILVVSEGARRLGVQPGMRVSAAYALTPALRVKARDVAAEEQALARLAAWSGRYTSCVSLVPPDALLLEIEGSERLYGSLDHLIERVRRDLIDLGYTAHLALAPTALGAIWLARIGREANITDHAALFSALAELPIASLGLDPKREALLAGLGLKNLLDCLRLPRDGIARRAGPEILEALDRAFGRRPDPRPAFVPPPRFHASLELPGPIATSQALLFPLHRLLLELSGFLEARGAGAAALEFTLRSAKSVDTQMSLKLVAPSRDVHHLSGLVRERLERVVLPAPVEEVVLAVDALQTLGAQPFDFFAGAQTPAEMRAQMVERLQARLGRESVQGVVNCAEHRPERAWRYCAPGINGESVTFGRRPFGPSAALRTGFAQDRPLWLLPEPMALEVRAGEPYWDGTLALEPERERIESGWWDDGEIARDYFIARDEKGRKFWVFRELQMPERWFLHGIFG